MADDRLREYYDAQQPSEALMEKLRAMEAPPKKTRRYVLPIAAAAVLALVLAAAFWPKAEPQSPPEPVLEVSDAAAPETPVPTPEPTAAPTAQPTLPPTTPPPVSLAAPTPTPAETPRPTRIIPNGTGAPLPPEESDVPSGEGEDLPGSPGDLSESWEYLYEDGRHLVRFWFPEGEEHTLDLTDLLVDGHFEGVVDAGDMYLDVFLTVYDDGTADLAIGGAYMKGEER